MTTNKCEGCSGLILPEDDGICPCLGSVLLYDDARVLRKSAIPHVFGESATLEDRYDEESGPNDVCRDDGGLW